MGEFARVEAHTPSYESRSLTLLGEVRCTSLVGLPPPETLV